MQPIYKNKTVEWFRRILLGLLLSSLLLILGKYLYKSRIVAEMNEYVTAFNYNGVRYTTCMPEYAYVLDTQIGKTQNGYKLYTVKGDKAKRFVIAKHTAPLSDYICFIKDDVVIPDAGEVSAVIIGGSLSDDERVFNAVRKLSTASSEIIKIEYNANDVRLFPAFICFDRCPVSSTLAGHFMYFNGSWYFKIYGATETSFSLVADAALLKFLDYL